MSKDDVVITDLTIPGKRGPFKLRVLDFDEAFEALFTQNNPDDKTPIILRMAQLCLSNGTGKPIYTKNQIPKMKKDVRPAATLMLLGMKAYKLNGIDDLLKLNETVEESEKNS